MLATLLIDDIELHLPIPVDDGIGRRVVATGAFERIPFDGVDKMLDDLGDWSFKRLDGGLSSEADHGRMGRLNVRGVPSTAGEFHPAALVCASASRQH